MRSVWICSRNDAIGNIAVLGAALGVFGTEQAWPDLLVASIMAGLAIWGSLEVFGQARRELAHGSGSIRSLSGLYHGRGTGGRRGGEIRPDRAGEVSSRTSARRHAHQLVAAYGVAVDDVAACRAAARRARRVR